MTQNNRNAVNRTTSGADRNGTRGKIVVSERRIVDSQRSTVGKNVRTAGNAPRTNGTVGTKKASESKDTKKKSAYEAQIDAFVEEELKKREKKRKLLIALCSLLGAACLLYVGFYSYEDYRTRKNYEQMAALKDKVSVEPTVAIEESQPTIHYTNEEKEVPEVLEEYKNLYNMNKKLIGWLKIDDTNIDYPVMQTSDNEYYLKHNINQEKDRNGALFLDKDCDVLAPSTNLIIYGHHMKSGRMFGNLDDYASEKFYKEHSIIQFDTIYEKGTYEVMYVFRSKVYNEGEVVFKYYQFIDCYSEKEFESNMQEMAALSLYDTGVTAEYGDELLTLSTCDNTVDDGRFVVVAKRID